MEHSEKKKEKKKKKKRAQRPDKCGAKGAACGKVNEESKVLNRVVEDKAASAHQEAKGDPNKAAEIPGCLPKSVSKGCSSSSDSSRSSLPSSFLERFMEGNCGPQGAHRWGTKGCIIRQRGDCVEKVQDRSTNSHSCTSESKIQDSIPSKRHHCRKYADVVTSSKVHTGPSSSKSSEPLQKVLGSLFKTPNYSEHERSTMYRKDMLKMMKSFVDRFGCVPNNAAQTAHIHAKGDEYQVLREPARQYWDLMESCYQKASKAYSDGKWGDAARLVEQGRSYEKKAQEADEKASQEIFDASNKSIENTITIDLHGQHIKEARSILKAHLFFGVYLCSMKILRVITGRGNHGVGESKLKKSVIKLLQKAGIEWREENPGLIRIRLDRLRNFNFLESDSDGK